MWCYTGVVIVRAVVDTNVVFEGLTKKGGAAGLVVDAWLAGLFQPCVSNALAYEYLDVLARKLSPARWQVIQPVLGTMLSEAIFIPTYFSWRPNSPDPADEHVVDSAMNAGAALITFNLKDFRNAIAVLHLVVITPVEFVHYLTEVYP